jgi:hypothetical protein
LSEIVIFIFACCIALYEDFTGFFSFLRQVEKGGEDAYFIKEYGGGVLGVADGVSG